MNEGGLLVQAFVYLAAAVIAVLLVGYEAGAPRSIAAAIVLVVAATAFAPRRTYRQKIADRQAEVSNPVAAQLTADDLATAVDDPLLIFDHRGTVLRVNPACAVAFPSRTVGSGDFPARNTLGMRVPGWMRWASSSQRRYQS